MTANCDVCGVAFKVGDKVRFTMFGKDHNGEPLVSGVHQDCVKPKSVN